MNENRYQVGYCAGYRKATKDFTEYQYTIVPKVPTPEMVAAVLPVVDNFTDEEIEIAKKIGAEAILLLSPAGRAFGPLDRRATAAAEAMVCDYMRMVAAAPQDGS